MASREELKSALITAHNAGNTEHAKILAQALAGLDIEEQAAPKEMPVEGNAAGRFLSGVGANVLDAASGVAELIPGVTENNPIAQAAKEGLKSATGYAGGAGKLVGGAVPYLAMPEGTIPAALTAAGIGAATGHGGLEDRAISGALAGAGQLAPEAVTAVGRGIGKTIGELGTHTGGETIVDAARAGLKGGAKQEAFINYLRDKLPLTNIVNLAEKGKKGVIAKRSEAYQREMAPLLEDKTILNYLPIEEAINSAKQIGTYEGHVVNPSAVELHNKLKPIIEEWSGRPYPQGKAYVSPQTGEIIQPMHEPFPPEQSQTMAGVDALKKRIGGLYDKIPMEAKQEKAVLDTVYGKVRDAIVKQNPKYGDIMEKDIAFRDKIDELTKELSITGKSGSDSTTLRKLLAIPRNNANTNYGKRVELARELEENGADNLMTMLNGAALNSFKPRGLGGAVGGMSAGGSLTSLLYGQPGVAAALAGATLMQSPRLMGEAALKVGQAGRYAGKIPMGKQAIISAILNKQNQE